MQTATNSTTTNRFSDLGIINDFKGFLGEKKKMHQILNREIMVHDYKIGKSKFENCKKCLQMSFSIAGTKHVVFTSSNPLIENIVKIPKDKFPFITTIVKEKDWYEFT